MILKSLSMMVIYSAIAYFHISQLRKDKMKKELWIFCILMLFIVALTIVRFSNMKIPNPLNVITILIDPLLGIFPK